MTDAPISSPPPAFLEIIAPLTSKARQFLEAGESLQLMAFVGKAPRL